MFVSDDLNKRKSHLHITMMSTLDNVGGAPIAAYRLFKGLRQLNQNAAMIVRNKKSDNPNIYKTSFKAPQYDVERKIFQHIQMLQVNQNRTELSNTWFSIPYPGYDFSKTQVIANSDIINLHWVAEFQSVETISNLLNLGKPVVWTLHDEHPYTGGCHYSAGCTAYQTDCRNCRQLNDNRSQIPFYNLENKTKLWNKNLTIVTPSKWLGGCAKKSRVFKDLRVEVIPNSLETDIFTPMEKNFAKKELGLEPQLIAMLVGAHSKNEKRKGFSQLLDAMEYCLQDPKFKGPAKKGKIKILTFGPPQEDLEKLDIEIEPIGYINDNKKLSTIYSAADIFILPSLEDNLPNTMLEAMACGTPVIGFDVGGLPDMIQHGVTGYLAPCFESEKLGDLILKLVFDKDKRNQMSGNCRQLIEKKFKLQHQAKNYLELFNDLLKNGKITGKSKREKSKEIIAEGEEIILDEWQSVVGDNFFETYRESVLDMIKTSDNQIQRLQKQVGERDNQIENLQKQVSKRDNQIENLQKQVSKRDNQIENLQKQVSKRDNQIENLQKQVDKKDAKINRLKDRINRKENEISKIFGSYTYRIGSIITFPFRKTRKFYRRIRGASKIENDV